VSSCCAVTSTTSVSPSHRPTFQPIQLFAGAGPGSFKWTIRTASANSYVIMMESVPCTI
jgi:hypothetical protein